MIKPVSSLFALKSIIRRKKTNLFAIISIAIGVSLLVGVPIAIDSMEEGFNHFFSLSLGKRDAAIYYDQGYFNESNAPR